MVADISEMTPQNNKVLTKAIHYSNVFSPSLNSVSAEAYKAKDSH
jgi:hypothetical protein